MKEETQEHIFWDCEVAQWAWSFVSSWWGIKVLKGDIMQNLAHFKSPSLKVAWGITWSVTLWTLWLGRNQLILVWCQSVNLLEESATWSSNPARSIIRSNKNRIGNLYNINAELVGFIDGAWKMGMNQEIQAGIGGYLKDKEGNLLFIFSGPVKALSAIQSEFEAMMFLVIKILESPWCNNHCLIYSDSLELVKRIQRIRLGHDHECEERIKDFLLVAKVEFKKVDRILNCEADNLAKQGATRQKMGLVDDQFLAEFDDDWVSDLVVEAGAVA
ncbi:hypothetical protein POM88_013769 [Heracleum sosnowskyi]|uniref:Uncharacterized protein n=1 Tax=Heracleum sosnowskyi TaxID=360622 RepID=A0AAD8N4Q3_9APIA|nr:hypothetical protein POM88_013769 [Heracleum sosnowskyi]